MLIAPQAIHFVLRGDTRLDLTQILIRAESGDDDARADLIQASYQELHRIASAKMAEERQNHTLTSTALVHEVSLRLLTESQLPAGGRGQFYAYAAKAMRHYLIDHARSKGRQKRGGGRSRLSIDEAVLASREQRDDFLALNEALDELAQIAPRKARLVELRYFGGLSNLELADALQISPATVKRDWTVAKAWLLNELRESDPTVHSAERPNDGS